jgi:nicotinate-nucleotide pyrophosphorylase (carboxylating)
LRWFEKQAVKIGGGENHRFGLYDMILIKDNHVDEAGSIANALNRVHDYLTFKNLDLRIELEVRNEQELEEALEHGGLDRIMLDNFSVERTRQAVERVKGRFELESSGGITLDTIQGYAETGVDFISVGALTHSVKSLDLSLKIDEV